MTDKELLELAAKAANEGIVFYGECLRAQTGCEWNPLTDDGDALRLAVKLDLFWENMELFDIQMMGLLNTTENVRRAIVRAAAEIGKAST